MSTIEELKNFLLQADTKIRKIILTLLDSDNPQDNLKGVEILHQHYGYDEPGIKGAINTAMKQIYEEIAEEENDTSVIGVNLDAENT